MGYSTLVYHFPPSPLTLKKRWEEACILEGCSCFTGVIDKLDDYFDEGEISLPSPISSPKESSLIRVYSPSNFVTYHSNDYGDKYLFSLENFEDVNTKNLMGISIGDLRYVCVFDRKKKIPVLWNSKNNEYFSFEWEKVYPIIYQDDGPFIPAGKLDDYSTKKNGSILSLLPPKSEWKELPSRLVSIFKKSKMEKIYKELEKLSTPDVIEVYYYDDNYFVLSEHHR